VALAILSPRFRHRSKQYLFHSTYKLKAQFDNVAGLNDGADVQVGGCTANSDRLRAARQSREIKVTVIMDLEKVNAPAIISRTPWPRSNRGSARNQFLLSHWICRQADVQNRRYHQSLRLADGDLLKKSEWHSGQQPASYRQTRQRLTAHLNSIAAKSTPPGNRGSADDNQDLYNNLERTTTTLHATMLQAQTGVLTPGEHGSPEAYFS